MTEWLDKDYPFKGTADSDINALRVHRWNNMTREERLAAIEDMKKYL